ncbi:nucleic acid-binding protein [Mycobacterium sp. 852002-51163_SCH5372311]|uniref:type II toxin-antitoxin system VapC family toxin n=1 Tax=Mycobacterium sp. 852002-51163_SCH5372311 TaxID=1834097 RepID=UPI0007FC0FFA|nr:type II toxin-antitoxin system VapC family toxin [Mycobacterium sp. 852002-51163_SCH5372311]OBF88434.1 nucleic acid-binding protein [Mycobacterium sp. 852002-51163_SCH5372311]
MQLYLDTSALAKLVTEEAETAALQSYLQTHAADTHFTSALTRTELIRAASRHGPPSAIAHARRLLTRIDVIALTIRLLEVAAVLPPAQLRTLDAIHLAAAQTAPDLRALVTYDVRMAQAAALAGIAVAQPV